MATAKTKFMHSFTRGPMALNNVTHTPISLNDARELLEDDRFEVDLSEAEKAELGKPAATPVAEAGADKKPSTEEAQIAAVLTATDKLDPTVETNFTSSGLPDARALTSVLGWQVTSELRNKAFKVDAKAAKGKVTIIRKGPDAALDTGDDVKDEEPEGEDTSGAPASDGSPAADSLTGVGADPTKEGAVPV